MDFNAGVSWGVSEVSGSNFVPKSFFNLGTLVWIYNKNIYHIQTANMINMIKIWLIF